jgi:small subunit ribosomal protein S9
MNTPKTQYHYANGKRKTAVARVRLYTGGKGQIVINGKDIKDWKAVDEQVQKILSPLELTGNTKNFDVFVKVLGGGPNAQAEAIRHGISKALTVFDMNLRPTLKKVGLLSRDSRIKERKKPGLRRARRAPQFSKR